MTNVLFYFLIPIGMAATLIALGIGIFSLAKGGDFAKEHSNKLMRMRVAFQGITIALMMAFVWLLSTGNG